MKLKDLDESHYIKINIRKKLDKIEQMFQYISYSNIIKMMINIIKNEAINDSNMLL